MPSNHIPRQARQRPGGLTLLETVVAIVVGLVVLGGVGTLVYSATSTNKVAEHFKQVNTIANNIQSFYAGTHPAAGALSTSDWIAAGIIPKTMAASASTVYNPWRGVVSATTVSGNEVQFSSANLPLHGCMQLVMKLGVVHNFDIHGGSTTWDGSSPMTLDEAQLICQSATSNTVSFYVPVY